ncbi:hypothetical protein C6685_24040, partial [Salmonella enterica subsp. enterica serovar Derby]|nr:hypothetical protein [Salmonella enterica subsp. enterica serovar Derby]
DHIMSKSLYPKTFFHFTNDIEKLESIITCKFFRPSYARETIYGKNQQKIRYFGIPMVSFCNIRLSLLSEHTQKYGSYGIGLTYDWITRNNLNPVFYVSEHSNVFPQLDEQIRNIKDDSVITKESYNSLSNILRYIKNHTGPLIRDEQQDNNYCFADEMEWRYVPKSSTNIIPIVLQKNIDTKKKKEKLNDKIKHIHLKFTIDDIKYIMLEK